MIKEKAAQKLYTLLRYSEHICEVGSLNIRHGPFILVFALKCYQLLGYGALTKPKLQRSSLEKKSLEIGRRKEKFLLI